MQNFRSKFFPVLFFASIFVPLLILSSTASASAGTSVSGSITNPVWTEANSPYIIDGVIDIAPGAKLVIQPGTVVKFNANAGILVEGELDAVGTEDNRIVFTSNQAVPQKGDWAGIRFVNGSANAVFSTGQNYDSGSIIKYANIKYSRGVVCSDAAPYFSNNSFLNNKTAIDLIGSSTSAGIEVLDLNESVALHANLATVYIVNNEMADNDFGILVRKNNGRDYINSPAGAMYSDKKFTTAFIINNNISNNYGGIFITKGDNNIILNNAIKFNTSEGLHLEGSSDNLIQGNTLNNNAIGITNSALNTVILNNNIEYNMAKGIGLNAIPRALKYNNIDSNKAISLSNNIGNMDISGNYWGAVSSDGNIVNNIGTATIAPKLNSSIALTGLIAPIVDSYIPTTNAAVAEISGIKLFSAAVYSNDGVVASGAVNSFEWLYSMNLAIGTNTKTFYLEDSQGKKGPSVTVTINRVEIPFVSMPAIDSYLTTTNKGSVLLSGRKQAGTGVWFNKTKVIDYNAATVWSYNLPLAIGLNAVNISVQDSNGLASQPLTVNITRIEADDQAAIDVEKLLTKKIDLNFSKKMAGRLLLQIENSGAVWYVNPKDNNRYYVSATNALQTFRSFATGITEKNLSLVPLKAGSKAGNRALAASLKGKFLLRVQSGGMISFVDQNGLRHDIGSKSILKTLSDLSLGISNQNIRKIAVGSINFRNK